jgi:hypothetical protein
LRAPLELRLLGSGSAIGHRHVSSLKYVVAVDELKFKTLVLEKAEIAVTVIPKLSVILL